MNRRSDQLQGILLGTAVGDTLGLPAENLTPQRIRRLWKGPWRQRFLLGRGMISDDTEHTLFVAQALLAHGDDPVMFQRALGWKLRGWLLGGPAGIGWATLRACIRLWCGIPPHRSGVNSAGNGPAMRSAITGGYFARSPDRMTDFVRAATVITHTDPRALTAALAVATVTAHAVTESDTNAASDRRLLDQLRAMTPSDNAWIGILDQMEQARKSNATVAAFAAQLGLDRGVSGYCYHTVPVAIYAVLRHRDSFAEALTAALDCGGDTDTVGAITGAMLGARLGSSAIPSAWIDRITDWPRSPRLLATVGERLAETGPQPGRSAIGPVGYFWPGLIVRNFLFAVIVLGHGLRRLAPPW